MNPSSACGSFYFYFLCKFCFYPVIFPVCFYLLHCGIGGNCWIPVVTRHPSWGVGRGVQSIMHSKSESVNGRVSGVSLTPPFFEIRPVFLRHAGGGHLVSGGSISESFAVFFFSSRFSTKHFDLHRFYRNFLCALFFPPPYSEPTHEESSFFYIRIHFSSIIG